MYPTLDLDEIEITDEIIDRVAQRLIEHFGSHEVAIEALTN